MGNVIKFFNNLRDGNIIPIDLMLHYLIGVILTLISFLIGMSYLETTILITIVAIITEIYDKYFKSKFSWKDILYTEFGLITGVIIYFIINLIKCNT